MNQKKDKDEEGKKPKMDHLIRSEEQSKRVK